MKIQQIQLILKERPEDTGNSQTTSTPARTQRLVKGVRYKPQPSGTQAPLTPAPGGRRGVRAGREREPRTAKHPALAKLTGSADTQCVGCWILGKQDNKTFEGVLKPAPL